MNHKRIKVTEINRKQNKTNDKIRINYKMYKRYELNESPKSIVGNWLPDTTTITTRTPSTTSSEWWNEFKEFVPKAVIKKIPARMMYAASNRTQQQVLDDLKGRWHANRIGVGGSTLSACKHSECLLFHLLVLPHTHQSLCVEFAVATRYLLQLATSHKGRFIFNK